MKDKDIEKEALEKYPKAWRHPTKAEQVAYFDPNQEKRAAYIAGRSKNIEREKELEAELMAKSIILSDYTEQIKNILKCLPKEFHQDISLSARIMNLWQYYEADENKIKALNETIELILAKDAELCEIDKQKDERIKELEEQIKKITTNVKEQI